MKFVTIADVLEAHSIALENDGGCPGIRDQHAIETALQRPINLFFYSPKATIFELAAYLVHGIIQGHPFFDGNKRTAMLCGLLFIEFNNAYKKDISIDALEKLTLKICNHESSEQNTAAVLQQLFK